MQLFLLFPDRLVVTIEIELVATDLKGRHLGAILVPRAAGTLPPDGDLTALQLEAPCIKVLVMLALVVVLPEDTGVVVVVDHLDIDLLPLAVADGGIPGAVEGILGRAVEALIAMPGKLGDTNHQKNEGEYQQSGLQLIFIHDLPKFYVHAAKVQKLFKKMVLNQDLFVSLQR